MFPKSILTLLLAFAAILEITSAQLGCTFADIPENVDTIEIEHILETTQPGTVLWKTGTEHVTGAVAEGSPHVKYINGLRYSSRYEYTASDLFQDFVTTERLQLISRVVTFSCEDGSSRKLNFKFNIIDENNSGPKALLEEGAEDIRFLMNRSSAGVPGGDIVHAQALRIRDMDLDPNNAKISVSSTQRVFSVSATLDETIDHIAEGYHYNIQLKMDWLQAKYGEYNFQIIASDGVSSVGVSTIVAVYP